MHPLALTVNANSTALLLAQEIQLSWDDKLIIQQDRSDKETGAPASLFRRDRATGRTDRKTRSDHETGAPSGLIKRQRLLPV
jgi:hypothetical protein